MTTVRFDVAEGGGESFIDLVAPTVHEVTLNGDSLDAAEVFRDSRIALPGLLPGRNILRVVADCAYTNTRRGPAPVRRPGRRPGLPVHAVRGAGRAPRLRELRAAGPQGDLPVHREGARRAGRSSPTRRRRSPRRTSGSSSRPRASRRTSRR
ncbi:hypothetical protein LV779_18825 [Streptomyces thinghirensis]|nr:hypothetical protein [Streptomyces thinghirensis]